jgi:hypothetical protein
MIRYTTTILQFAQQGEKTGWTYIVISAAQAEKLIPGNKRSFRVKGKLDDHPIKGVALLPMGEGQFIMPLNATIRKAIRKRKGDKLKVELEVDKVKIEPPSDLMECLADEPSAQAYFKQLPRSHQNYFGNWVRSAKGEATRAARIARVVTAMAKKQTYAEMIRSARQDRLDRIG